MKIIVVSDSHGNTEILDKIVSKHKDADYFLHAGDSSLPADLLHPYITVKGNCDYYKHERKRVIDVGEFKIFITHGHLYSKNKLLKSGKENDCKIVIYGHTHITNYELIDDIILLNPGSVARPRGGEAASFTIITYNSSEDIKVKFEEVNEL